MKYAVTVHDKKVDIDSNASPDEILARAKEEGIELTDEQLEQVSGGAWFSDTTVMPSQLSIICDNCGGTEIELTDEVMAQGYADCPKCGTRYML